MLPQQERILLRVLYEEDARDLMHALDCEDLADRMDMPWDRLQLEVADLEEKGYVVLKYRPIGTLILCNVYLTIKGIEWAERNLRPPPPPPSAQIFLSYAREDEEKVEELYQKLSAAGFKPWMDTRDILPGEKWTSSIRGAIRDSDFFLVCLSTNSVKKRGWVQRERKRALDLWEEMLDSDIYLIPVRLEDCEAPESLRDLQWVDLFEEDGWEKLVKAIQVGMERRAEVPTDEELSSGRGATPEEGPERVPHMDDKRTELEKELAQHEQNLRLLLGKKAIYATGEEPLYLLNQLEAEKQEIESIKQRLAQLADEPLPADEKPSPNKMRREILELLYESPSGRMSFDALVERLNASSKVVQRHLGYLEKREWVILSTRPLGARVFRYYSITPKGMDSVERGLV